jgi:hypothetical protein
MKRTMKLGMLAVVLLAATAGRTQAGSQFFDFSFMTDDTTPRLDHGHCDGGNCAPFQRG